MPEKIPSYRKVTKQMLEAALMTAAGHSVEEIASKYGKTVTTVRGWLKIPEVKKLYNETRSSKRLAMVAEAEEVLKRQLKDPNPWVASQAARECLRLYGDESTGEDSKKINVVISGLPDVGMPERADGDD